MWNKIKQVWFECWIAYKMRWAECWNNYKTVIIPFIKGTFAYLWTLIEGLLAVITKGLYNTGKIIYEWIIEKIKKA